MDMCLQVCIPVYNPGSQKRMPIVLFYHSPSIPLRQDLSINPKLSSARLERNPQALVVFLSSPPELGLEMFWGIPDVMALVIDLTASSLLNIARYSCEVFPWTDYLKQEDPPKLWAAPMVVDQIREHGWKKIGFVSVCSFTILVLWRTLPNTSSWLRGCWYLKSCFPDCRESILNCWANVPSSKNLELYEKEILNKNRFSKEKDINI